MQINYKNHYRTCLINTVTIFLTINSETISNNQQILNLTINKSRTINTKRKDLLKNKTLVSGTN